MQCVFHVECVMPCYSPNKTFLIKMYYITCIMTLAELDLHCNVLTKLPDAVADAEHLKVINLANNKFSVFPEKLLEITTLETINLEGNSITGNNAVCGIPCI